MNKFLLAVFAVYFSFCTQIEAQTLLIDIGSSNNYRVNYPANFSAGSPSAGIMFTFKAINANTGISTLILNSYSAIAIKKNYDQDLQSNDIKANAFVTVIFDGTYWQMLSVSSNPATSGTVSLVSTSLPLSVVNGSTTPSISITQANGSSNGYLSSTDWTSFSNKIGGGSSAGGDLSGSYPNPSVIKINGFALSISSPSNNQALVYNGSQWVNNVVNISNLGGTNIAGPINGQTLVYNGTQWQNGQVNISNLGGTNIVGPTNGQALVHNGSQWVNGAVNISNLGGTNIATPVSGQLLSYNGIQWINAPPPAASGAAGGDLSGAYPTPTINSLAVTTGKIANSAVDLTTKVTGILPVANGGTGVATTFTTGSVVFTTSLGAYAQNNTKFFWDNTNLRLGIGYNAPAVSLHLDNGIATAVYQKFTAGTTTNQTASDGFDIGINNTGAGEIRQRENLPLLFFTNNLEGMRLDQGGKLGVGTISPINKVDIAGAVAIGSYAGLSTAPANSLIVSGNIGIATPTPNSILHVNGSMAVPIISTSIASQSLANSDLFLIITGGGGTAVTLPAAAICLGRIYIVKVNSGGSHTLTNTYVNTTGTGGTTSMSTTGIYRFISDGTNWQQW